MQSSVACNLILIGDSLDSDPYVDFLDKDAVGWQSLFLVVAYINITMNTLI